jgi:hypothetical protein
MPHNVCSGQVASREDQFKARGAASMNEVRVIAMLDGQH